MKAINLLSSDARAPRGHPALVLPALVLALVVGIGISTVVYLRAEGTVTHNGERLTELRRSLALVEARRQRTVTPQSTPAMSGLRSAVFAALKGRGNWSGLLRGVGRVIPPGAWLTKLSVSGGEAGVGVEGAGGPPPPEAAAPVPTVPAPGAPPGAVILALTGCALDQDLVGRAVSGVNRLPGASEMSVDSTQKGKAEDSSCGAHPSFQLRFSVSRGAL